MTGQYVPDPGSGLEPPQATAITGPARISAAFTGRKALVVFLTGGDPDLATTEQLILALAQSGADLIEIGIPFSDPVAEGSVIQAASQRALAAGCTVDKLFDLVARIRPRVGVPVLFMTYINPIFVYGKDRFMKQCASCGVDGVIVPDLPFEERAELAEVCARYGIAQISMIAPTSEDRIKAIARQAEGFLYCVSSLGVTGMRTAISGRVGEMIDQVRQVSDVPCAVGFGISTPEQARAMAHLGDGVIIGSAIVDLIAGQGRDSLAAVTRFTRAVRVALDQ